jgi:NAD(P)-dependent dehydrogenase (short-subunit alcohol dehydrogenase family)
MARSTPLARFGSAGEVADAAMFLLTNPFMTGTVVAVNGGLNLV